MSVGEWIIQNLFGLITLGAFLIGHLLAVARAMWLTKQTATKVDRIEAIVEAHIYASGLHRTPDFEERLKQWDKILEEIRRDLKQLLEKEKSK